MILTKIIKIVATSCQNLWSKCTKFDFGWCSTPDLAGELTVLPQTPTNLTPALDPVGLDPAVLAHFSFPTLACRMPVCFVYRVSYNGPFMPVYLQ